MPDLRRLAAARHWRSGRAVVPVPRALIPPDPPRHGPVPLDPDIDAILSDLLPPLPSVYVDAIAEAVDSQQLAVAQTIWMRLIRLHPHLELREFNRLVATLQ
ncbi:MAG TPA: hypothetical protein VFP19_04960, partial [Candidatus Limnocylindrales bacterium]|nr:hypothetical protein [Candidatus Limnocylindrales bacterium]